MLFLYNKFIRNSDCLHEICLVEFLLAKCRGQKASQAIFQLLNNLIRFPFPVGLISLTGKYQWAKVNPYGRLRLLLRFIYICCVYEKFLCFEDPRLRQQQTGHWSFWLCELKICVPFLILPLSSRGGGDLRLKQKTPFIEWCLDSGDQLNWDPRWFSGSWVWPVDFLHILKGLVMMIRN